MPLFAGQAEITIDAKQRVAISSKFRAQLEAETPNADETSAPVVWYAMPWPEGPHIRLIPEETFRELASEQAGSLTLASDEANVRTTLFSLAERLEMDKAGRVRIPKNLLEMTQMPDSGEVVVLGANHWLEIRERASWRSNESMLFAKLPDMIDRINESHRR